MLRDSTAKRRRRREANHFAGVLVTSTAWPSANFKKKSLGNLAPLRLCVKPFHSRLSRRSYPVKTLIQVSNIVDESKSAARSVRGEEQTPGREIQRTFDQISLASQAGDVEAKFARWTAHRRS